VSALLLTATTNELQRLLECLPLLTELSERARVAFIDRSAPLGSLGPTAGQPPL